MPGSRLRMGRNWGMIQIVSGTTSNVNWSKHERKS